MNRLALAPTTLPHTAPMEYLRAAVAAGYDAVGVRLVRSPGLPFHPVVGDAPLIREVKRVLADASLPVLDILSFYLLPATDVDQFTAALELGAELGGKYAMAIGDDPEWARLRDNLGRLCDAAARFGLTIVIEFVPHRALAPCPWPCRSSPRRGAPTGRSASTRCTSPDRGKPRRSRGARRSVLPLRAALRWRPRPRRARPRPGQTARDRGAPLAG